MSSTENRAAPLYHATIVVSCLNAAIFFVDRRTESVCPDGVYFVTDAHELQHKAAYFFSRCERACLTTTCTDAPLESDVRSFLRHAYPHIRILEWESMSPYRKMPFSEIKLRIPCKKEEFVSVSSETLSEEGSDEEDERVLDQRFSDPWFKPLFRDAEDVAMSMPLPTWKTVWNLDDDAASQRADESS
jgi:hypothetical protein